jgi:hypothetical protein
MRTCAHCNKRIPASRGINPNTGYRMPTKYCSDRCRRDASDQRVIPPCRHCGKPLKHRKHTLCLECIRIWTPDRILDAIRDYADRYGHPPAAQDWNPPLAITKYRDDIAERFHEDGCWPTATSVQYYFGSWNAAIHAAGFTPLAPGHKYSDFEPRPHGRMAEYKRGCRCEECRLAMNAYERGRRKHRRTAA